METLFFFPLIDRLVCTIQSNQTLDALIKNVAYSRSLYSDQFEIRLNVYSNWKEGVNRFSIPQIDNAS